MKTSLLLSLIVAILCTVMSCKKAETNNTLVGNYTRTVNGVPINLYITDATHFSYSENIGGFGITTSGTYTAVGNEVDFTENSSSSNCPGIVGKYSFNATTANVTFSLISDLCSTVTIAGDRSTLVVGVWTRQ